MVWYKATPILWFSYQANVFHKDSNYLNWICKFWSLNIRKWEKALLMNNFMVSSETLQQHSNVNTLRPRQNGSLFSDDTFKRIFVNENIRISIKISLKFVPKSSINNNPALVLIMAWRRPGDKPLSEPMLVRSLTHICVTRPQWVKV